MSALDYFSLRDTLVATLSQAPYPYVVLPDDFNTLYPQAITYAEGRIYKDLVMLATRTVDTSLITVSGTRSVDLNAMTPNKIIVPEGFALLTPAGSTRQTGTQTPFDEASLDTIDQFWPTIATTMGPADADNIGRYWALQDDHTLVFSPTPDAAYTAVVTGLFQPVSLSETNTSTYLSEVYPELLTSACLIWLSGALLRNFGASADDPRSALSWEATYQALMATAKYEEARRRGLVVPDAPRPAPAQAAG
jgi:hypothetical protein